MQKYLYQDLFSLEESHWWHISKRRIIRNLMNRYLNLKNPRILDIGCGTGKNIEELKDLGKIYGLDSSKEALKFCKKRGLNNLIFGSAEKTTLKNESFDLIMLLDVLEHTNDNKTLDETYRILKKEGIIILTVPAFSWLWSNWDVVLHHRRRYTTKNLTQILKQKNFEIIKISYMYSFLVLPAFIIRKIKSFFSKEDYSSDFKISSSFTNHLLNFISQLESFFILTTNIPFGTSIIAVARKKK